MNRRSRGPPTARDLAVQKSSMSHEPVLHRRHSLVLGVSPKLLHAFSKWDNEAPVSNITILS